MFFLCMLQLLLCLKKSLFYLGEYSAKITPLGKAMSRFPVSPRFSKMLILSYKHMIVPYVIAIISAMTIPEVFLHPASNEDESDVWTFLSIQYFLCLLQNTLLDLFIYNNIFFIIMIIIIIFNSPEGFFHFSVVSFPFI